VRHGGLDLAWCSEVKHLAKIGWPLPVVTADIFEPFLQMTV
jgi:hypothetical protein